MHRIQNTIQKLHPRQHATHGIGQAPVCGIVGVVSKKEDVFPFLYEGLKILENRGYDSAGITTIDHESGALITTKHASSGATDNAMKFLQQDQKKHHDNVVGIGHTRWATHGPKTDINAHPHHDMRNRVALAHNGVIENATALREELEQQGCTFLSETDSEVISQMIGQYLYEHPNDALLKAVQYTVDQLEGTWGLVILDRTDPNTLIAVSNGSPLLIGVAKDKMFVASEAQAFGRYTKEFIALEQGEIATITPDGHSLDSARVVIRSDLKAVKLSPAPYPHWTIREICEQPVAISRAMNYGGRFLDDFNVILGGLEGSRDSLVHLKHLVLTACGTSLFASMFGAKIMRSLHAFETVHVIDAAEFSSVDLPRRRNREHREGSQPTEIGFCCLSQSGETRDVVKALQVAMDKGVECFSIVNTVRSYIARTTGCGVYVNAGRENAVASTKAFSCQVTVLCLVAIWFAQQQHVSKRKRQLLIEALHRLPINVGMAVKSLRGICKETAGHILGAMKGGNNTIFVLGKGLAEPIAREGALKIKEIAYIHAEAYSGGALKHGPYALLEAGTPIIMIVLDDEHKANMLTAAAETKTRGATVIAITDIREDCSEFNALDAVIRIPNNGPLSSVLAVLPLQLIAYECSIQKGINPDRPRNLAKCCSTD